MEQATVQPGSSSFEMSLREHLLAQSSASHPQPYPPPLPPAPPHAASGPDPYQRSDSQSPHEHIDPTIGGAGQYNMSGDSAGEDGDARKGKRELSTSKRAAQNRAAQRAFRQRKEGYIKKLEEQVRDFQNMEQNYRALQNENYQLREYILNLQSRLLESQSEFPAAPPHVTLPNSDTPHSSNDDAREHLKAHEQQLQQELKREKLPVTAAIGHEAMPAGATGHLQATAAQAGGLGSPNGKQTQDELRFTPVSQSLGKRPRADSDGGHWQ